MIGLFTNNALTKVTIGNSVMYIGQASFWGNRINSITIPNSVISIDEYAFEANNSIKENIVLPNDVIGYSNEVWKNSNGSEVNSILRYSLSYNVFGDIESHSVAFIDHDNTILKTEILEHGSSATAPADPERNDGIFIGWDKSFDYVSSDLTVVAQYDFDVSVEQNKANRLKLYPNPATTQFKLAGAEGQTLSIYNVGGTLVKQMPNISSSQLVKVGHLPKGVYIVKVGETVQRLLIK